MKNKITGLIIALFAMVTFTTAKAQCMDIENNLTNCKIEVEITYITNVVSPPTCNTACNTMPIDQIILPNGGMYSLSCMGCGSNAICDIQVKLTKVGGSAVSPITVTFTSGSMSTTVSTMCGGGLVTLSYTSGIGFSVF